jgi:accessory gene regulator protein AgrB
MFPLFSLLLFIFVTYPKEKIKENDFYFLKNLDMSGVRMQKYPKSTSTPRVKVPKKYPVRVRLHFWSTHASQFITSIYGSFRI